MPTHEWLHQTQMAASEEGGDSTQIRHIKTMPAYQYKQEICQQHTKDLIDLKNHLTVWNSDVSKTCRVLHGLKTSLIYAVIWLFNTCGHLFWEPQCAVDISFVLCHCWSPATVVVTWLQHPLRYIEDHTHTRRPRQIKVTDVLHHAIITKGVNIWLTSNRHLPKEQNIMLYGFFWLKQLLFPFFAVLLFTTMISIF